MIRLQSIVLALGCMSLLPALADAQTTVLDEGTFRIMLNGREVGRETFSIRQSGSGGDAVIVAQGRISLGGEQISSSLELQGAGLRPAAYEVQVEGDSEQRITGRVSSGRFSARILSAAGEQMREYLASDGAVVADDGVAHHYYFVAQQALQGAANMPLLIPRQSRQTAAQVALSEDRIEVGGRTVSAQLLRIEPAGGDERRVWVDGEGRVLRVEVSARGYVAVRASLPD
ncbi:MAG: hypothetical protein ACRELD_11365 [Longimicrobiales bacterium]